MKQEVGLRDCLAIIVWRINAEPRTVITIREETALDVFPVVWTMSGFVLTYVAVAPRFVLAGASGILGCG